MISMTMHVNDNYIATNDIILGNTQDGYLLRYNNIKLVQCPELMWWKGYEGTTCSIDFVSNPSTSSPIMFMQPVLSHLQGWAID